MIDEVENNDVEEQQPDVIIDILSGKEYKLTDKERILQRMIQVLAGEYHFPLESIERDVPVPVEVNGKRRTKTADLIAYKPDGLHSFYEAIRIVVVQPPSIKISDLNRGVNFLKDLLDAIDFCEFGLWTNGRDIAYLRKIPGPIESKFEEISDFPGSGEELEDMDRPDRRIARVAVAEDLRETILRCHDYLYGNQSMTAPRAFSELVKLIFAKIYDERQLRANTSYQRLFWVGITERNTTNGQEAIAWRVNKLFSELKQEPGLQGIFRPGDEIELAPKHLAWIAAELSRYNFLDTEVDVKGMAYEAMVATTMKRERGQFFTPRNVVEAMVEILAPQPGERVFDPACGSGRFLVACLDRFRRSYAEAMGPASSIEMRRRKNSREVLSQAAEYAKKCLFGVDVDPELQRAAKMNMILNNDGHGNIFVANSLEISPFAVSEREFPGAEQLGFETFDIILTNPPFGAKIPVDDPIVLRGLDLGYQWQKTEGHEWVKQEATLRTKMPPEILFIERCLQWLKEGGRMGIVVPDGILGNPGNEHIRAWILQHARILASIDLPVEAFLPQVGVQASLLFLQKKKRTEISTKTDDDYPIFMAVTEFVGHDRRGNPVFRRDPDGYELYESYEVELPVFRNGRESIETRKLQRKQIADDLPLAAKAYRAWKDQGVVPSL